MTKDEALKIEDSDFKNHSKQQLFEHIVELREAFSTHPHQWQGLTDDEIEYWECLKAPPVHPDFLEDDSWREFARCIEQALKEKNT